MIGWEAHESGIIKASFKTKHKRINTNIIQCYAPTNDAEEFKITAKKTTNKNVPGSARN